MPKMLAPRSAWSWRILIRIAGWSAIAVFVIWGAGRAHALVVTDHRFDLTCCGNIEIRGAIYTNRGRIQNVFTSDFGRSIFRIPLAERRRHLLAVDWVNTASITRVWPDRLVVSVTERRPVAFAKLPIAGTGRYRLGLIDREGVLLSMPPKVRFRLPVLSGVSEEQSEGERKLRVNAMQALLDDLGPEAKSVSEINASSTLDLRLITTIDGRALELWMGNQDLRSRYMNFIAHYDEIRKSSGKSGVFDLRMDDRILAK